MNGCANVSKSNAREGDGVAVRSRMRADSVFSRCLAVLGDGPSTTADVVAETGFTPRKAGSYLYLLFKAGKIARSAFVKDAGPGKHWGSQYLWMLPEHAQQEPTP